MWISLEKSSELSEFGCVYLLYNNATGHIYVGATSNIRKRLYQWRSKIWDHRLWDFAIVRRVDNYVERHRAEARVIYKIQKLFPPELVLNCPPGRNGGSRQKWRQFQISLPLRRIISTKYLRQIYGD